MHPPPDHKWLDILTQNSFMQNNGTDKMWVATTTLSSIFASLLQLQLVFEDVKCLPFKVFSLSGRQENAL